VEVTEIEMTDPSGEQCGATAGVHVMNHLFILLPEPKQPNH
jgi:hypothetical protein